VTPERLRLHEAGLLLRLRALRREQAQRALVRARDEHRQALEAVRRARQRLDAERGARAALLEAIATRNDLPRWAQAAEARRAQV
jgi:hypothetical protein